MQFWNFSKDPWVYFETRAILAPNKSKSGFESGVSTPASSVKKGSIVNPNKNLGNPNKTKKIVKIGNPNKKKN